MTAFDGKVYIEAIAALKKAAEEADQADAMLRGIGCRDYAEVRIGVRWFPIQAITDALVSAVKTLETVACEDCGQRVAQHPEVCTAKEGDA